MPDVSIPPASREPASRALTDLLINASTRSRLTPTQLAERAAVRGGAVSSYLSGRRLPPARPQAILRNLLFASGVATGRSLVAAHEHLSSAHGIDGTASGRGWRSYLAGMFSLRVTDHRSR
jgi:hypothetical protein